MEDWEEWEDDEVITPIDNGEQVLIQPQPPAAPSQHLRPPNAASIRASRHSTLRIKRLKSRHRQKAQNAKAGIRLITDMSAFRRQPHIAHHMRPSNAKQAKFVDAAALRALEGEPSSASVGNWNWLKRNKWQSPNSASPSEANRSPNMGLSPDDRPIMIGMAMPSGEASSYEPTPVTATTGNTDRTIPTGDGFGKHTNDLRYDMQQQSFWSPDTPDTTESLDRIRPPSSVYSQATIPGVPVETSMPPVPALPASYKRNSPPKLVSVELRDDTANDDDADTPCTLFEEDGTSPKATRRKSKLSPDSAGSPSRGWWDHVVSPFADKRMTFASRKQKMDSPIAATFKQSPILKDETEPVYTAYYTSSPKTLSIAKPPIVRIPTPRRSPSPGSSAGASHAPPSRTQTSTTESPSIQKPRIIITTSVPTEGPPPYSPPKRDHVRYRAVFPPGHPLQSQFPPSPSPASPGLAATMTSQGATQMTNLSSTPPSRSTTPAQAQLPTRAVGTYLPQEHAYNATGPQNRVERTRRRHEKEDLVARRIGGFWRGRACIPDRGCFGRTGREGRKKRRICMAVWGTIITSIITTVVLAVVLTRGHKHQEQPSIWVNLTDYPPMPTGVLTVVGPDNTISRNSCTEPSTLWSCSLPKEDHESVAPYKPNQPTVIMQIQWDNDTRNSWKVENGNPPPAVSKRSTGFASLAGSLVRSRDVTSGFSPQPAAPSFNETWFLGETTDNIVSDEKAGEPTPFYISILQSVNDTIAFPGLRRRQNSETGNVIGNISLSDILPPPDLESDGTPAPAVLLPKPVQQPVRLFDRGLETEHYGFYTSFKRTIFLKSVTVLNQTNEGDIPLDENGGCRKTEAEFLTTWGETRMLVRMWTRKLESNTSSLLKPDGTSGDVQLRRPGTMPYPVTVTLDTHGGDPKKKLVWELPMDNRQRPDPKNAKLLANDMSQGGTWINPRGSGDPKFGGFDGGTGGCKCEWVNWV